MKKIFLISLFLSQFLPQAAFAKSYDLEIKRQDVFITGKAVSAITINGTIPGPTLYFEEGDEAVINVKNSLDEKTSIHWHGILLPGNMDGVPGLNGFEGIKPGEVFTYKFKIRQKGTYWYHSHSNLQEQEGMYGSIVIEPRENKAQRDYVILLSDFTEENPRTILNNLKIDSGYYNYGKRTIFTFFDDVKHDGFWAALNDRLMWGQMRMDATDLADVTKYHFLINGKTNNAPPSPRNCLATQDNATTFPLNRGNDKTQCSDNYFLFKKGESIRLRFINAGAMSFFDVSILGFPLNRGSESSRKRDDGGSYLKMKLVEADGQKVKPLAIDEFRIGPAETYDVIVEPRDEKAYTIFAESIDRSGYARGTLAPKEGMTGEIPTMRPRAVLNMADMGMPGHQDLASQKGWDFMATPEGKKALSYSDLISLTSQKDLRQPTREIEFRFGGQMNRYIWTINGEKFPKPIHLKFGERVRLKFVNDTMMAHPVHLHGMFMQLENEQPMKWMPNKHTIIARPGRSVTALLTADEEGEWAFHCHLLYHMANGMMTSISVEKKGSPFLGGSSERVSGAMGVYKNE